MINDIIKLLEVANGETENIRIAQGKHKAPETVKEGFRMLKKQIGWPRRK